MKEIKLTAQPNDTIYYITDSGLIANGEVYKIALYNSQKEAYFIDDASTHNIITRTIIGNTVDELLQNLKNEHLQRTSSSQPITT